MKILIWHVHGAWTTAFVHGPHDYLLADISTQSQLLLETSTENLNELSQVETQLSILGDIRGYLRDENSSRVLPSAILPPVHPVQVLARAYGLPEDP